MKKQALAILAASRIKHDFMAIFNTVPVMLPFNGKPLACQTILHFIKDNNGPIIVALPKGEEYIGDFLETTFAGRARIIVSYIANAKPHCQMNTLKQIMDKMQDEQIEDMPLLVANGDIYFEITEDGSPDKYIAWVDNGYRNNRYSQFLRDGSNIKYIDINEELMPSDQANAVIDCGIYSVPSWKNLARDIRFSETNMTVGKYLAINYAPNNFCYKTIKNWMDLGNLDSATKISTKLLGAREFNDIKIDEKHGLIYKSSEKKQNKILQEINYYIKLPKELKIYFPRLYDFSIGKKVWYSIEYYPYKTLSEYFVMYELSNEYWTRVFDKIFEIIGDFNKFQCKKPEIENYREAYIGKLEERMISLRKYEEIYTLTEQPSVKINGKLYFGWKHYLSYIKECVDDQFTRLNSVAIHGDLCFSNILYDPKTNLMRLIDPRGEFFGEGIYGDPFYDIAKIMHSVHGGYDFIIQQMYILSEQEKFEFSFNLIQSDESKNIKNILLNKLNKRYTPSEIRTILIYEALLFLTMLPFHSDDVKRQKALYLTSLIVFDQADNFY